MSRQLGRAVRINIISSASPRPAHHTTNTTGDQRKHENLYTTERSKAVFASSLVDFKVPILHQVYTEQMRHLHDSVYRDQTVFSEDLNILLPHAVPISVHLTLSQMRSKRYDPKALDLIMANAGLDSRSLPRPGFEHTVDNPVQVHSLCLATSTDSEVKLATSAVYEMKEYLKEHLHTDLVGISSVKLHADTLFTDLTGVFAWTGKEAPFQAGCQYSTWEQSVVIHRCTDPTDRGWSQDSRYLFGGFKTFFDVRLLGSIKEGLSGTNVRLFKHKPSVAWKAFFEAMGSCTLTGENATQLWTNLGVDLDLFYDIELSPARIVESNVLMIAAGCGSRIQHMNSMLYQTLGSPVIQEAGNDWTGSYEDLDHFARIHLFGKVSSAMNIALIYIRLFNEDVFPNPASLCFVFGLSKSEVEFYLSDCLLAILDGLAIRTQDSDTYDISRRSQLEYLEGITGRLGQQDLDVEQVRVKVDILKQVSNFGYRSIVHGGSFTALGQQSDFFRRYSNDPERFSAFFISSQKYGSFMGFKLIFAKNNQTRLLLQGDVSCADPHTIVRQGEFRSEYHPLHRNVINELRNADGVRPELTISNLSSHFLSNLKVKTSQSPGMARGPVGMIQESMMVEGSSVLDEINAIFLSRDLHVSEDHSDEHEIYAWWSSSLGQRLEKVLRIFFHPLTGRPPPYIRSTNLYEWTCTPHQAFSNTLTPVTASFKRRRNKRKYKQVKQAAEKENLRSVSENVPVQDRLGPTAKKRFRFAPDTKKEDHVKDHLSKRNVISPAAAQWTDETPSTSRRKSPSKPVFSRLGRRKPNLGGCEPSGHQSKHLLGGVVRKEQPWEFKMASSRYPESDTPYTDCATGGYDVGIKGTPWEAVVAGYSNPKPKSSPVLYPEEAGKKARKNMRLDPDSELLSEEEDYDY